MSYTQTGVVSQSAYALASGGSATAINYVTFVQVQIIVINIYEAPRPFGLHDRWGHNMNWGYQD